MKGTMKVGVWYSNRDVRVEKRDIPEVGDDDLLMEVKASGICGTDIMEWYRIKKVQATGKGLIQGHEIAGKVVEVGKNVDGYRIGDRIMATHHVPCDSCRNCLRGNKTQCDIFQRQNNFDPGGNSEFVRVSGRSIKTGIIPLEDEITYEQATFIEPLGTVRETVRINPGDVVVVFGCGVAGILNIKNAKAFGARLIVATDVLEHRLKYASEIGADYPVPAENYSPEFLRRMNEDRLADKVIVCAAAKSVTEQALQSFGDGGEVIFFATPKEGDTVDVDFFKHWRSGFKWQPTYGATPAALQEAYQLIRSKVISVEDMITHRLSLDNIAEGYRLASEGVGLKVIIEPNQDG